MDYYRSFDRSLAFRFLWQEYEPQLPEDWKLDSHFARNCFDTHRVEPAWDRINWEGLYRFDQVLGRFACQPGEA